MKGYTHDASKGFQTATVAAPPFAVGAAVEMDRAAQKGLSGESTPLEVNAKYGIDGYEGSQKATEMGRSTRKSAGGAGPSSLPPPTGGTYGVTGNGDAPTGKQCYGISGVAGGGGQGGKRSSLRSAGGTR